MKKLKIVYCKLFVFLVVLFGIISRTMKLMVRQFVQLIISEICFLNFKGETNKTKSLLFHHRFDWQYFLRASH